MKLKKKLLLIGPCHCGFRMLSVSCFLCPHHRAHRQEEEQRPCGRTSGLSDWGSCSHSLGEETRLDWNKDRVTFKAITDGTLLLKLLLLQGGDENEI